jgi:tripeptide aminopeptidase
MDRVENGLGIRPQMRDGVITSGGSTILAADDLAGVSAILDGMRRTKESGRPHCSVEIVFTVSEEIHLEGSRHFDFGRIQSGFGFVFDSSGPVGRIVNSAPSAAQLTIETYGKKAHAGAEPEKGKNALLGMAKILCDIKDGRLDFETTANYAVCSVGDAATNIVCDYAKVLGEVRSRTAGRSWRTIFRISRRIAKAPPKGLTCG